jgi:hypothetical protein
MAGPASAQPLDKRTLFTFSGPIAVPGVTLPAGQDLFPAGRSQWRFQSRGGVEPEAKGQVDLRRDRRCLDTIELSTVSWRAHRSHADPGVSLLNRHHTQLSDAASGTVEAQRLGKGVLSLSEVGEEP